MHVPVHTSSIPCINRVIHAIAGKDLRVISFFDQLTHLRNYRQRSSGKRERERENNKCQTKRNFPLPRRFSAYPWPWPRFTCSFSSWPLPTRDDRCYVKGRPLVPCSRKVRSMILRRANNVFPLEGRCYVSTKQGRLFGEQGGNGGGRGALGGASNLPIHSGESRLRPNSSS